MAVTAQQRRKIKKFVNELESHRGRHTELVSVYIPAGYDINKINQQIFQEKGTASNIKSSSTRKNVEEALEKMLQHLKLYKKTPENGLAAFSGNTSEREGQSDVNVWSIEPPIPLKTKIYRCDKEFVLEPLREMMESKQVYGMIVMDRRDAIIAVLKGKTIVPLLKTHSEVPGKFRAGGQCLVEDTLVQMSDGRIDFIKNIKKGQVESKDNYKIRSSSILDYWESEKTPVKIITKHPRMEIVCSPEHVILTNNGDKEASNLTINDTLLMPEKINIEGKIHVFNKTFHEFIISKKGRDLLKKKRKENNTFQKHLAREIDVTQTTISSIEIGKINPKRETLEKLCSKLKINFEDFINKYTKTLNIKHPVILDNTFAQFLGYLMGDGCMEEDRISFFEQSEELAKDYKFLLENYFKKNINYRFRESKNYHQLRLGSRSLVKHIKHYFPEIKKAKNSKIPELILTSKKEIVASFLKGLYDAEGYVSMKLGFGINNKVLAQQVQMCLLRFGIVASLLEYDNRRNMYSNSIRYTLEISEKESLKRFKKYIGLSCKNKSSKLDAILKRKSNKSNTRQILVDGKEVRKIIEEAGYLVKDFPKVSCFFNGKRMMSKNIFEKSIIHFAPKARKELTNIKKIPILPVKIMSISQSTENVPMIDISVEAKNFIANGLFVHNSAQRFARLREGAAKSHYKKVAEYVKEQFLTMKNLKGILVGGPGPTKYDFVEGGYFTNEVKKKIIAIKDLSYTDEFGLQELLNKSEDVLAEEEVADEKKIMKRFFETLAKEPGKTSYGEKEVMEKLKMGAVDILLLSEELEDEKIEEFEKVAEEFSSEVKLISTETREGAQLRDIGKIAAILRYEI